MTNPLAGVEALRAAAAWSKDQDEYLWDNLLPEDIIITYQMVQDLPYTDNLKNLLTKPLSLFESNASEADIDKMDEFRSWFSTIRRQRNRLKIRL